MLANHSPFHRLRHPPPSLGLFSVALCAAVLLVFVPSTVRRDAAAREALAVHLLADAIPSMEEKQKAMLRTVMVLQDRVAKLSADVAALNTSTAAAIRSPRGSEGTPARVPPTERLDRVFGLVSVRCDLEPFELEVTTLLKKIEEEAEDAKSSFQSIAERQRRHFLIKWHGTDGVHTSNAIFTEVEAEIAFERVGDFAKKMLLFQPSADGDNGSWSVARAYGGENWLSMMTNDGTIQNPPKQSSAAAVTDDSVKQHRSSINVVV